MGNMEILNSPIRIGGIEIKNRIVMAAMDTNSSNTDGTLSRKQYAYYTERARGGAGLIITEAANVTHPDGLISERNLNFKSPVVTSEYHDLTDSVHAFGCKIIAQLNYGGAMASPVLNGGVQNVSASEYFGARAMTKEEVKAAVSDFIHAAEVARDGGFDGIELHAAHMYLINQFLSPASNKRTDEYGGSLENRFRLLKEILVGIREACPSPFILSVRFAPKDVFPEGTTLEEGMQYAKWCEEYGADLINVTYGFTAAEVIGGQWQEEGSKVYLGEAVKKAVSIPVAIVGKMRTPEKMAKIIENGQSDMIVVGRQLICDPYFPSKIFAGKTDEIRPCLNCIEGCLGQNMRHGNVHCAINPYVGYEDLYNEINVPKAGISRRIVIVGAGIAGLQAGIIAKKRGHDVLVLEKEDKLGGQMNIACIPPFKECIRKAGDWFIGEAERIGLKILTGVEATVDIVAGYKPDAVILATGSTPFIPPIQGVDLGLEAWEVLQGKNEMREGSRVTVIGGGVVGAELSHKLIDEGYKVTIIEMLPEICFNQEMVHKEFLENFLREKAVIMLNTRVEEICADKIICKNSDNETVEVPTDYAILSVGQKPSGGELYRELLKNGISTYKIGDAEKQGNFRASTRAAMEIAYRI